MSIGLPGAHLSPWGLDPHQIAVPTHLWVGEDDQRAPPVMARYG
jgi:hypothetical protein